MEYQIKKSQLPQKNIKHTKSRFWVLILISHFKGVSGPVTTPSLASSFFLRYHFALLSESIPCEALQDWAFKLLSWICRNRNSSPSKYLKKKKCQNKKVSQIISLHWDDHLPSNKDAESFTYKGQKGDKIIFLLLLLWILLFWRTPSIFSKNHLIKLIHDFIFFSTPSTRSYWVSAKCLFFPSPGRFIWFDGHRYLHRSWFRWDDFRRFLQIFIPRKGLWRDGCAFWKGKGFQCFYMNELIKELEVNWWNDSYVGERH